MIKNAVRKEFLQRRMNICPDDIRLQTDMIAANFRKLKLPPVKYLLSYNALSNRQEFDVSVCQDILKLRFPDMQIAWPRIQVDLLDMEAGLVETEGNFIKNCYNILEPIGDAVLLPEVLDIIFVPLIAFDARGYRVGYGKGYYDRYLVRCRPDALKIGFSFFGAVEYIEDIDNFDVPLNICITPDRIYEF